MTEGSAAATDIWKPADLTGKAYYTRSFSGTDEADFTAEVCLAHDAEAGEARLISTKTAKE